MMNVDPKVLGQKIRLIRQSKNLSQQELGNVLGRTHAAISDIELGKTNLTVQDLNKIAIFLGTSVSALLAEQAPARPIVHHRNAQNTTQEDLADLERAAHEFMERARRLAQSDTHSSDNE